MIEKKAKKPLTLSELKQQAMMLLGRREYGSNELIQKLSGKGSADDVAHVIGWLQEQNMQSDHRYAQTLLRSKASRGYGPQRIRQEMQQKRLAADAVAQAFEAYEGDWFEQALNVYEKKFKTPMPQDHKERAKRQRFLQYRGYSSDQISYAIEQGHQECTNY